jgi:glycosyltransferase involved in cell wall biosynthesis
MSKGRGEMQDKDPLVSIIINNYNYARFLGQAINSALHQSWKHREVIIVDDGSTDESRDLILRYGDSVISVFKENGGQGSAFNAGFAVSRGEIICFLDADDMFLPHKVETLVNAWLRNPSAGLLYHQLLFMDQAGERKSGCWPSSVLTGSIKNRVVYSGGWWPHPTTSALACTRDYLQKILPMPLEPYRICADAYVGGLAPFLSEVVGIREPLARYRIHDANNHNHSLASRESAQTRMNRYALEFQELKAALKKFCVDSSGLSLERHYPYQWCRWKVDAEPSLVSLMVRILCTPSLPFAMKARAVWNTGVKAKLT